MSLNQEGLIIAVRRAEEILLGIGPKALCHAVQFPEEGTKENLYLLTAYKSAEH